MPFSRKVQEPSLGQNRCKMWGLREIQSDMERETGIEPATNGLGSRYSTIELLPPKVNFDGSRNCNLFADFDLISRTDSPYKNFVFDDWPAARQSSKYSFQYTSWRHLWCVPRGGKRSKECAAATFVYAACGLLLHRVAVSVFFASSTSALHISKPGGEHLCDGFLLAQFFYFF